MHHHHFFIATLLLLGSIGSPLGMALVPVASAQNKDFTEGFNDAKNRSVRQQLVADENIELSLERVIKWLLGIVGILAVLALVYAGAQLIVGFGNEDQAAKAKKIIFWAIGGLVVTAFAWVIITVVINFF